MKASASTREELFLEEKILQAKIRNCNAIFDKLGPDQNDYIHINSIVIIIISVSKQRFSIVLAQLPSSPAFSPEQLSDEVLPSIQQSN